ncbi:uncharacterized protein B0P05DRAFT_556791 [Gilbertella persicaria]|uniref:uncharacterized protein n=1 Tax=Gilbertella persicaria TaxID=101096 RepID=UPI002220FBE5|nr:uncharacterized protein B0P05DRAFT_556791 [Gilbertella persicaria]KAI8061825.1 hypothetical protein B0P05DRAFT_556791 [Gilbertella persicaria]
MVLSAPQDPLLRSSHSADTRRRRQPSSSPPYYPGSDGNLSTSSSTGSLKRRRSNRKNRSDLQFESTQEQFKFSEGDGIDTAQKRLKGLNLALYPKNPYRHLSWKIGEQVEAIKWTGDAKEWYCARVVEILNDINDEFLVFVHYEGWAPDEADWISPTLIRSVKNFSRLQYGPKGPENDQSWKDYADFYDSKQGEQARYHTGLVQDRRMSLHCCPCHSRETIHPERPDRISSILQTFHSNRMLRFFKRLHAREITAEELLRVHTFSHVRNYYPLDEEDIQVRKEAKLSKPLKITSIAALLNPAPTHDTPVKMTRSPSNNLPMVMRGVGGGVVIQADQDHIKRQHRRFSSAAAAADASQSDPHPNAPPGLVCKMTCGELGIAVDTTFHPLYSSLSARVSAGALLALVEPIVEGYVRNGFALIRPPGHHAEDDMAMGYCFYNNVAVAVAEILEKYPAKIKKILIIDWDIHHGNGTQKIFYDNPNVLYISIHRWDKGQFYPFTGAPDECGEGPGTGLNVNIAFSASEDKPKPMGDTEFVAAFYHFVLPIAKQFHPDMIFVSAGFDAAEGHPENLGGYHVTPRGYAIMTKMIKDLAEEVCDGRLVLTLEGGYELQPLAATCAASVAQLFQPDTLPDQQIASFKHTLNAIKPNLGAVESFREITLVQQKYWKFSDAMLSPNFRFSLPNDWRATDSISTRPRRDKKPIKIPIVEGY